MLSKNYLSERETIELTKLVENPVCLEAMKKILLAPVYDQGVLKGSDAEPTKNFALQKAMSALQVNPSIDNESLGEDIRANTQAIRLVELGIEELNNFKPITIKTPKKVNEAR